MDPGCWQRVAVLCMQEMPDVTPPPPFSRRGDPACKSIRLTRPSPPPRPHNIQAPVPPPLHVASDSCRSHTWSVPSAVTRTTSTTRRSDHPTPITPASKPGLLAKAHPPVRLHAPLTPPILLPVTVCARGAARLPPSSSSSPPPPPSPHDRAGRASACLFSRKTTSFLQASFHPSSVSQPAATHKQ